MELALTEEQALLHETTVRFIDSESPLVRVRALHEDPVGFERSWLQKAAELGWFSLLLPEADGGGVSDNGVVDATILAEEIGRNVQPGPFVPMNVVAAALAAAGTDAARSRWLEGITTGTVVATWAPVAEDASWDAGAGVVVAAEDDGYVLRGRRGYVQDLQGADLVLVAGVLDGRPVHVLVPTDAPGVQRQALEALDLSRRFAHLELRDVRVGADALLGDHPGASADRLLGIAVALTCAETVGAMDHLFSMTVGYSKDRIAFGRPIGSFQALKHIMADLALDLEACKAASVTLARAVGEGRDDADVVVSTAAPAIAERSDHLAQMALQIHGGIGYTWEHDLHLLMRRIRGNAVLYGDPTWHRERLCALRGLGEEG